MSDNLFMASKPSIPNVEMGFSDAKLADVQTIYLAGGQYGEGFTITDANGNKVNRFRWIFTLVDEDGNVLYDDGDPIEVDCVSGLQFFTQAKNPSKQVKIMRALLRPEELGMWESGEGAPPEKELLGRPVQVEIALNDKGYPTILSVIAPRRKRAAAPADKYSIPASPAV